MIFGSLVPHKGRLALEILDLDGKVVDYQEMNFGSNSGSANAPAQHAASPTLDFGSSYYHYDISLFDMNSWVSGAYSGANWQGYNFSIDVSKFWTSSSISITTQTSVTDFWGSSISGPQFESSYGHSQSEQWLDIFSLSFDRHGVSQFSLQGHSEQSFDYDHFAFGAVTIDTQHSEQAATTEIHQVSLSGAGISGYDELMISHDLSDSFRFATPTSVSQQVSSVHDDLDIVSWFANDSNGWRIETDHAEHQSNSDIGLGFASFSSHDVAIHEVTQVEHQGLLLV